MTLIKLMTTNKVKQEIKKYNKIHEKQKNWKEFQHFMLGSAYGIDKDGNPNWYEYDIGRYLRVRTY